MPVGRVLIAEDDPDVRKSVRLVLTRVGFEVVEAEDGEQAIAALSSDSNRPEVDAIVCDLYMPKVSGFEAIAYFRAQHPSVPVIVLTVESDIRAAQSLFQQGVVEFLAKPFTSDKLVGIVDRLVREHKRLKGQWNPQIP